jgi:hypothetical protein
MMHMPHTSDFSSKNQNFISTYFSATKNERHKVTNSAHNITYSAHKVRNKSANYYFCFGEVRKGYINATMNGKYEFKETEI